MMYRLLRSAILWTALVAGPATGVTIDLTSGVPGTIGSGSVGLPGWSGSTETAEVFVVAASDLVVTSLTLDGINVASGESFSLAARIYDASSGALIASSGTNVLGSGLSQSAAIPLAATLTSGSSYLVGVYTLVDTNFSNSSLDHFDPDPPGTGGLPYLESNGLLQVIRGAKALGDALPGGSINFWMPRISLSVALDTDADSVVDANDNCPSIPNGPALGTCQQLWPSHAYAELGSGCFSDLECQNQAGACSLAQEDFDHDGVGNVCDEEFELGGSVPTYVSGQAYGYFGHRWRFVGSPAKGECLFDYPYSQSRWTWVPNEPSFPVKDCCLYTAECIYVSGGASCGTLRARVNILIGTVSFTSADDPDGDGYPSQCDNCPGAANYDQLDSDGDGLGDACDAQTSDADGDELPDGIDNCPQVWNEDQLNADGDGRGDLCDSAPSSSLICADTDQDLCNDCSRNGVFDPRNDGLDSDHDGTCDAGEAAPVPSIGTGGMGLLAAIVVWLAHRALPRRRLATRRP
jgi:hypothetical protein